MAKDKDLVHEGKRSWWDGTVRTLCGLRFSSSSKPETLLFASVTCPACKRLKRAGVRL